MVVAVATLLAGCRERELTSTEATLRVTPSHLDFGQVYLGGTAELPVTLLNTGRRTLYVEWKGLVPPFEAALPTSVPSGSTELSLRVRPEEVGPLSLRLVVHHDDQETVLTAEGEARPTPDCPASGQCQVAVFDSRLGRCVASTLSDGTVCDPHSACVMTATCQSGRCVGVQKSCDDANACTVDVCNALTGCEHLPAPPCPGDGKCQLGVCHPQTGCGLAPADDGTVCGPTVTCDAADVCIAGQCVQRNPPDGFVCAPASPCQEEGRCAGSVCQRPPATALQPTWSFDTLSVAPEPPELHDLVLEPGGQVSLMGFFAFPRLRANTLAPVAGVTPARRCILWNGRLVCADYPYTSSGKVSALDLATGTLLWTLHLPSARPDLAAAAAPGRLFMARLAALGSDRLAALFEAFPAGTDATTQCREYFLAVLDAGGNLVSAQKISDPFLEVCSHPHPYGVVSNVSGDLFIAFSHSQVGVAPLVPLMPSLLVSYSRDGVLRWKRLEQFVGGELASSRGLIYPEKSGTAHLAATGAPYRFADLPSGMFGRIVATLDRVIPSPTVGDGTLRGYEQGSGHLRWQWAAPGGFASDQIRLAGWKPKPSESARTVALVFTQPNGQPTLTAVDARTGGEQWSCALSHTYRTQPQLFEVANGSIALMEGSDQCGTCDPPFAQSRAAFHTFALPGVEVAAEPWVGTFGGAGHDHHEDFVPPPPVALQ